jgi:membrane-associated PAP2 superfamily phosphatase
MSAIVTALLALLLQGGFVPLNLAAAVLALLGLRQIRREPERYIGRAFCWLAIALVLVLAVLTALVEPTPSAPPAEFMVPEQNATER